MNLTIITNETVISNTSVIVATLRHMGVKSGMIGNVVQAFEGSTFGDLDKASDAELLNHSGIGEATVRVIRDCVSRLPFRIYV